MPAVLVVGAGVVGLTAAIRLREAGVAAREGGTVVHCYGHGGAGVTLAWGCAEEVVGLVVRALG